MRLDKATLLTAGALSALLIPLTATPAAAAGSGCEEYWGSAYGYWEGTFRSDYKIDPVNLHVQDKLSDGHHAAIRLVTKTPSGTIKNYSWHRNYDGAPRWKTWSTYLDSSTVISAARVDVAIFEGSVELNGLCHSPWDNNPY
jgi:hypothetical protein